MPRHGHQASSPNPLPPEATGAPPSGQSLLLKVLSAFFTGALLAGIVFVVLPEFAETGDVGAVLESLRPSALLLLLAGGFVVMLLNALAMSTPLRQLSNQRAFVAQQACTAVSNVIPGPSGTAARFVILRSWGIGVEDFTRSTFAVSVWSNVTMISMPGIAFLVLAITQGVEFGGRNLLGLAAVAIVVSAMTIAIVIGVLRSIPFARWLGRATQAIYNPLRRLFRKPPVTDLEEQAVELRLRTVDILHERGGRLTAITVGNYWFNGLLLTVCLWLSGITNEQLPLIIGLALYSVGRLSTIIQVTPGGIGVVEVAYTAVYVAYLGDAFNAQVLTGVLLYRTLTYLLPILVGGICYLIWRRTRAHAATTEATA
jgi:uncharacterized protein (TIRG00374 family)